MRTQNITIRPAMAADLPAAKAIYDGYVATSIVTFDTRGVGRQLYAALLDRLRAEGCHTALGVIALPNGPSIALHEAFGFERAGVIREVGHKFGQWIDTAIYQLIL